MRNAAAMDPQQAAQAYQYPMFSGFTPVNSLEAKGTAKQSVNDDGAKTKGKAKAPRSRTTQSSATPKPRKAAVTKKFKKSKTAAELPCQDISKDLSRTKPAPSGNDAPLVKTVAPSELILSEPSHRPQLVHDVWADLENYGEIRPADVESCPSGLADKYQLAYANQGDADNLSEPAIVEAATGSSIGRGLFDDGGDGFEDFLVPTSAQGEKHVDMAETLPIEKGLIPFEPVPQKAFNSDEVFGDQDEADEFFMDDEGLEEFMQWIAPTEVHDEGPFPDWQPQYFNDDPLRFEEPEEHVKSDGTVPASSYPQRKVDSAALPIYRNKESCFDDDELDEGLTVLLSDANAPGLPGPRGEADHAKEPEYRNISDNEEHHQDRFALSDGPIFASSPNSSHQSLRVLSHASIFGGEHTQGHVPEGGDGCFDDDELDEDLVDLTADCSEIFPPQTTLISLEKPPSSPKLQRMPSKTYTPTKSSQIPIPYVLPFNENGEALPFTRPPFPKPIRDRSPILGLTNCTVLRTCFRIGEALNAAAVASRTNTDAIIELYARTIFSEREINGGFKQFFQFGDMFTDKPPYLSGTYTLWKGVDLWDVDSKPFLGEKGKGKMARVMGRIKRCEQGGGCEMVVLSIWEVDWEDVGVAKGIVCL